MSGYTTYGLTLLLRVGICGDRVMSQHRSKQGHHQALAKKHWNGLWAAEIRNALPLLGEHNKGWKGPRRPVPPCSMVSQQSLLRLLEALVAC